MCGALLLVWVGVLQLENLQIEWTFLSLLAGTSGAALSHYLIAKVFGPLLFGRLWCGWACWTLMIPDLLPFQRSPGRIPGGWQWLRYDHFVLSFVLVLALWVGFGYAEHAAYGSPVGLVWMLAGNAAYYEAIRRRPVSRQVPVSFGAGLATPLHPGHPSCTCPASEDP